jgi:hypothetical protein
MEREEPQLGSFFIKRLQIIGLQRIYLFLELVNRNI